MYTASFLFYDSLNDFLTLPEKDAWLSYSFSGNPGIKDAIESLGVPHPEIYRILVNGIDVGFSYHLKNLDKVEVYPKLNSLPAGFSLQTTPAVNRFILDVHLGKLAKSLRMLGFDAEYENTFTDKVISARVSFDERIVLTRDVNLLKRNSIQWGYWLRSQNSKDQLKEVIRYFNLKEEFKPFTRCLECNVVFGNCCKTAIYALLPPKAKLYFNEFYQCPKCLRVYWKGSHYERMLQFVESLK